MIPVGHNQRLRAAPVVTWTLLALNVLIYFWDRQGRLFGEGLVFADLAMRPREIVGAIGGGGDPFSLVTLFTALFLHGGLAHLLGNMLFLFVFGTAVEEAFGSVRFTIYYLFWGFVAWAAQIYVDPGSSIPTLGASGAIGGVLGAYLLLYPSSKLDVFVPILLLSIEVSAWVALGLWFLYQILIPQQGVANWAHVGGFLAGMLTVLIAGGRSRVLAGLEADPA